ncbi:uncharacterized protein LOC131596741 [Vicia villosa]|uniref:uncharacterized protein LOC131596741 n=1 Tax=Vicia villosa TaxID=3911 RepID=UPI00273CCEA6|nr:uncharacterized protein LOC131596741 [Vicia villosa]
MTSNMFGGGSNKKATKFSFWWKDIQKIISYSFRDPLVDSCRFSVHNGFATLFWEARWLNVTSLKDLFPDLYGISRLKFVSVAAMGGWKDGVWVWGDLGVSELEMGELGLEADFAVLLGLVEGFKGWKGGKDSIEWDYSEDKDFTVASCYTFYNNLRIHHGPPNRNDEAFGLLWKLDVPFKIKAFGWRLFLDRLPVKDLLKIRGITIPLDDLNCFFCGNWLESSSHLFFSCLVVKNIWSEIANWVGKGDRVESECLSNFMDWHLFFHSKKVKHRKLGVVWLATTWTIWLVRNGACFQKEVWNVNNIVWNAKHLAWRWSFCGKITHPNYSFYEFCKDPLHFLS